MMKYLLLSALSAAMLMTGCTQDAYENDDEQRPATSGTVAVGFASPGIAEAVAWIPAEAAAWTPAEMQNPLPALADAPAIDAPATDGGEGLVLQLAAGAACPPAPGDSLVPMAAPHTRTALPANTTVRVVAYTAAQGNPLQANYAGEQTYYMKDGKLEPCTVNADGSFKAADADASLLLESTNYDFFAISPALPLNSDRVTLSVANGVDYASSVTRNVEATETVALTQMERKCVRLELSVAQPAGVNFFETLTVKSAQLSALSAARTVTIGSDIPAGTGNETLIPVFGNPSDPAIATGTIYLLPVSGITLNVTYNLSVKEANSAAKDLTVKNALTALTLDKGKSYTLAATVRNGLTIGELFLSNFLAAKAEGEIITVKSPSAPAGMVWSASLLNPFNGVTLGSVSGSGSTCAVPVTFGLNPNTTERTVTLMAQADWAETSRTAKLTQAGSWIGNITQTPGNNIAAEGKTVTVTTPKATPGLSWGATLSNTTGFTLGTVSGSGITGSVPVTVAVNPTNTVRSTVLTVKAKEGNTSGTTTITQAAASLTFNSPNSSNPVAYTATSVAFTVTGTKGLQIRFDRMYGFENFSPKTLICNGSAQTITVTMPANTGPKEELGNYSAVVTNAGASGLNLTNIVVAQAPNPRAAGYITEAGDPTGLPAGMFCIGMHGGKGGALYVDKRGTSTTGVNQGTGEDIERQISYPGSNSSTSGQDNQNSWYCAGKGMFFPALNELRAIYNAKGSMPVEYRFGVNFEGSYWSSTGKINYGNKVHYGIKMATGAQFTYSEQNQNTAYIRCVREW